MYECSVDCRICSISDCSKSSFKIDRFVVVEFSGALQTANRLLTDVLRGDLHGLGDDHVSRHG